MPLPRGAELARGEGPVEERTRERGREPQKPTVTLACEVLARRKKNAFGAAALARRSPALVFDCPAEMCLLGGHAFGHTLHAYNRHEARCATHLGSSSPRRTMPRETARYHLSSCRNSHGVPGGQSALAAAVGRAITIGSIAACSRPVGQQWHCRQWHLQPAKRRRARA